MKSEMMDFEAAEKEIGYSFHDRKHLIRAFTHKSYSNENPKAGRDSYERYEFLGDAILEYLCSKELFERYPKKTEGELTKMRASLVCEYTLSQITRELGFGQFLSLSHGEELTGGRNRSSILCDLFESVLGAVYLDGGMPPAESYVNRLLMKDIESRSVFYDAKSRLQEYTQAREIRLTYRLLDATGPEHNRTYHVACMLGNRQAGEGYGASKKMAEQIAAHETLKNLPPDRPRK